MRNARGIIPQAKYIIPQACGTMPRVCGMSEQAAGTSNSLTNKGRLVLHVTKNQTKFTGDITIAKVNNKEVKEQCNRMNDAWVEGAPTVELNGISQSEFAADITDAANDEAEIADLESQLNMKRDVRDGKYAALNAKRSNGGKAWRVTKIMATIRRSTARWALSANPTALQD